MEIRSGATFKNGMFSEFTKLEKLNYDENWTEDTRKNNLVTKIFENYFSSLSQIEETYKNDVNKVNVGDDLQPGIVQLAKVYIAKKTKTFCRR